MDLCLEKLNSSSCPKNMQCVNPAPHEQLCSLVDFDSIYRNSVLNHFQAVDFLDSGWQFSVRYESDSQ